MDTRPSLNFTVMFLTKFFQLVELIVKPGSGNNSDIYFQQQPQLQSYKEGGAQVVYIKAIETFSNSALTTSPLTTGSPVATPADLQNGVLTLVENGTENKKQIPLTLLNRVWPVGPSFEVFPPQLFLLKDFWTVDWTKCYVTTVLAPPVTPFSYMFGVHYSYEQGF